jgi:putative ABC transport system permease protein
MLIIAFGIMALVGILTAIDSLANSLNDSFSGLGANSFTIQRKYEDVKGSRKGIRQKRSDPVAYDQAMEFKDRFVFPATVSISYWASGLASVGYNTVKTNPNIGFVGIDEHYIEVKGMNIAHGRNLSPAEVLSGQQKVILGMEVAKKLFRNPPTAVDKIVTIGGAHYIVVGVMASKGAGMNNSDDKAVYVPLYNAKKLYGTDETDYEVTIAVNDPLNMDAAVSEASGVFRVVRKLSPGAGDDFEIFKSDSLVSIVKDNTATLQFAAIAIGLMTLLGAAIGLMNIMLVSVTERTKEIGIYKALGATKRSILIQFLMEAILICQAGGILGILGGIVIGNILPLILGGTFLIPWAWMTLGLVICMAVGIISGFYPAMKAAQLDPIESLRYE